MDTIEGNQAETQGGLNIVEANSTIVRAELQRVMQNRRFSSAPQMSSFLKYIVEETLDGHSSRIKAYSVGVDALGKPPSFDAQTDPSVRVLALRLRKTLAELYQSDEKPLAIIVLRVGSYAPEFYQVEKANEPELPEYVDPVIKLPPVDVRVIPPTTMVGERHPSRDDALISDEAPVIATPSSSSRPFMKYLYSGVALALLVYAALLWSNSKQATSITAELSQIFTDPFVPSIHIDNTEQQSEQVKDVVSLVTNSLVQSNKFNIVTTQSRSSDIPHSIHTYRLIFAEFVIFGLPRIDIQIVHESSGVVVFSRPLLFDTNLSEFSLSEMSEISRLAASISMNPGPIYDHFCKKTWPTNPCDY